MRTAHLKYKLHAQSTAMNSVRDSFSAHFCTGNKMGKALKKQLCFVALALVMSTSSFAANTYYINDVLTGSDIYCSAAGNDGNSGTSAASPCATLTHIINTKVLGPDDIVYIDAGLYNEQWLFNSNADGGSSGHPLIIQGAGMLLTQNIFSGAMQGAYISGAGNSYITFKDLYIETTDVNQTTFSINSPSSNIILNTCYIETNCTNAATAVSVNHSDFCSVLSCTILSPANGILAYNSSNCVYDGNTVTAGKFGGNSMGIFIEGNAFATAFLSDNNVISSNRISGASHGLDIQEEGVNNTWVNNYVWNCDYGMWCDNSGIGIHPSNTFKFNSLLTDRDCIYGACSNWTIQNNILYTRGGAGNYCINLLDMANDPSTLDYNLYYYPGGQIARRFATTYNALADWKPVLGKDAASKEGDPLFTSLINLDLQVGSPATSSAVSDVTVTDDVRRSPAIIRTAVNQEIGAFEFACNSVGGTVTADATVCSGSNSGTLTLAGHNGSIVKWQSSVDNFVTPVDIVNVTTSQTYTNIVASTKYRAVIQDGACAAVNSAAATITVDAATVAGSVTADATVCSGSNGATLTLAGHTGSIVKWQSSIDNFVTPVDIANVTTTQIYLNITTTTKYRAVIKSGTCAAANSAAATITVDAATVAGAVTADATVCSGTNGANLTLAGHTGSIVKWQSSTDNFVTPVDIANVTTTQAYLNITTTTKYRAVVKSGTCASDNSNAATITVDPVSVGGTVTADATVCSGANSGTLTLAGNTGTITGWESSTDNFVSTTPIVNLTASQSYTNIVATTKYRAVVKSGTCASANSTSATISVDPVSAGGGVTADATVCSGANTGTLNLAGNTGSVTGWESSTDNFVSTTPIVNVTTSLTYTNITTTTKYRAVVKSGSCASANSTSATITVDPVSVGGTVAQNATVCSGSNSGTLTLAGNTGLVIGWESSTDNFVSTTPIVNVTTSQSYTNIIATTKYRAIVQSGTCASANSSAATITVDPVSVGGAVTADITVCSGANAGTLTLAGNTGSVTGWESSTDNFVSATPIVNLTTSLTYTNIATTTKYRAVVKSGTCASANSTSATVTVDPVSRGGTVSANATVCSGSNSGKLFLAGYTGIITGWESSVNNFGTSTPIVNLTDSLLYNNISTTTKYRALVKSGVCVGTNSSAATITVDPVSVGGVVTADATVCSGANSGTVSLAGNTGLVTGWESSIDNFVSTTPIVNTTSSQTYTNIVATTKYRAIVKSGTCASDNSSAATITINPVSVGGTVTADATVCSGANSGTLTLAGNTGSITGWESSTDNFTTSTPIVNLTASQAYNNITLTTKYRAIVKSGICPSTNSSAATLTIDPISVTVNDKAVCDGSSTTFDAGAGFTTYTWTGLGTGGLRTTPAATQGTYTITVTNGLGCTATDNAFLTVNTFPSPKLGVDTFMCQGQAVTLDPGTNILLNYLWSNAAQTATISVNTTGQYIVTVSDNIGCSRNDTIFVQVHALPSVDLGNDVTICNNDYDKVTLTAQYSGTKQLLWSTGQADLTSIVITAPESYWVQVTDSNQCSISDSIAVTIHCDDFILDWPDVITPNGDGINDVFKPKGVDDSNFPKVVANVRIISFGVYDRWGRFMFYSEENVLPNWDGKFNGLPAASGTYYFVIRYQNSAGKNYEIASFLTLME